MAAIDLLLDWSPISERMHQIVLAGLLRHTGLLEMVGIPGEPVGLEIETDAPWHAEPKDSFEPGWPNSK